MEKKRLVERYKRILRGLLVGLLWVVLGVGAAHVFSGWVYTAQAGYCEEDHCHGGSCRAEPGYRYNCDMGCPTSPCCDIPCGIE